MTTTTAPPDRTAELLALVDSVVAQAAPGEQVEAYVSRSQSTAIRVYQGEIEHFESAQGEGIGIRVIRDGRTGFSYAGTLDAAAVAEVLADARDNVQFGSVDEWAGLAEPDGVAVQKLTLWDETLAVYPTDKKIELTKELERRALARDSRLRIDDANYADGMGEYAVASTTGMRTTGRSNSCYATVSTLIDDGDESHTGWGVAVGDHPDEIDLDKAADQAHERAVRLLGAVKPASRRLTVVLDPQVAASFLGIIAGTLNGEAVLKGRSLFAHRLGEQVAAPFFTLIDDPTDVRAYTAREVDGEGLAARRNVLMQDGVLTKFVQSSYSGRRSGTASTGNGRRGGYAGTPGCGCHAIQVVPGTRDHTAIVADIDDGVLIQSVAGLHSGVNPVSGDFSTGASGVMIRNGALAEPVREFTIASTLQRMLMDITEVGSDLEWLPGAATGVTLVVDGVMMSGA